MANASREQGVIDERVAFIAARCAAMGGGAQSGPTQRGKAVKGLTIVDRAGLSRAVRTRAASVMRSRGYS
ncbi:MAG: hypothetical protein RMK97_08995 [Sutterellaceae bacterium]|nr:hypothetical protein [Burkholderiaceae bacterium]MDW8430618.1 hypothetical protein [Sutterellaceae bacterium]